MKPSAVYRSVAARDLRPFNFATDASAVAGQVADFLRVGADGINGLERVGISGLTPRMVARMQSMVANADGFGMDSLQASVTPGTIGTPLQFLQSWLPGFVNILTQALKIDEFIGMDTVGRWQDEEIVQTILENSGLAILYSDLGNVPYANWNPQFERRTIVRAELGMRVGKLEEMRAAEIKVNDAESKRQSATLALDVFRNDVGFNGFNGGLGRTYGFLNDPNLPAANPFPATGTGSTTTWSTKSFANITADIRLMVSGLRTASGDNIDPKTTPMTLGLPTSVIDFLSVTTDYGESVQDWINKAYPKIRCVSAPQLANAISSSNAAVLWADVVTDDRSTDNKRTWAQLVQAKFMMLGVSQQTKGTEEDYSNATAGALLKRPYAVVRYYGC